MPHIENGAPAVATQGSPDKDHALANADLIEASHEIQAPEIERTILREEVYEAAAEAINYLGAIMNFTAADDVPGLRYSYSKFAAYGRVIATGCKKLIASDAKAIR